MKIQRLRKLKSGEFTIVIKITEKEFIELYKVDMFLKALIDRYGKELVEEKTERKL